MRLWSIHPKYLDSKGLVACWREALLAQKVLCGKTKGYKKHPQLIRFKKCGDSLQAIGAYLAEIYREAEARKYLFDCTKIIHFYHFPRERLTVTKGQIEYEWRHLENKLTDRLSMQQFDIDLKCLQKNGGQIEPHPLFIITPGGLENWEVVK